MNSQGYTAFADFCKDDRFQNMRRDAIMEAFRILQGSKYARFLHMYQSYVIFSICLNMAE